MPSRVSLPPPLPPKKNNLIKYINSSWANYQISFTFGLSFENNLCEIISITTGTTYTLHACLYTLRSLSDTEYKSVS